MTATPRHEWLARLEAHYAQYLEGGQRPAPGSQGFARLFRHWFTYDANTPEPLHGQFLEGLSALVTELTDILGEMSPGEGQELAALAVGRLLAPAPQGVTQDQELYLAAAQQYCLPLLAHLSREDLEGLHRELLTHTPKRLMYPKQLEVAQEMERLLKA